MFSMKGYVASLLALNLIAFLVFLVSLGVFKSKEEVFLRETIESKYFINKPLALATLQELIQFEEVPLKHYNLYKPPKKFIGKVYSNIYHDPQYCSKVLEFLVENPNVYFKQMNFIADDLNSTLMRSKLVPQLGADLMPQMSFRNMSKKSSLAPKYMLDPRATIFYLIIAINYYHEVGRDIACLFQEFNHISGIGSLARKDRIAAYERPQCFDGKKFFPKSNSLDNQTECLQWFDYINSDEYEAEKKRKTIVFIRKLGSGSHQGKGVQPVDEEEEKILRRTYQNGTLCSKNSTPVVVQEYIHNPLLVKDHKFDFRIYMLIASVNPVIVYYHDGFLRVSLFEYDVGSKEKGMHLTNTAQSMRVIEKAVAEGMNETELKNFQMWNLTRFTDHLVEIGKVKSRDWLEEYLKPSIQLAMQHLIRMTQHTYYPASSTWSLLGMDFMLDDNLNLWFIEGNAPPELKSTTPEKEKLVSKMVLDMFDIVVSLARSRLKRAIKYINWLNNAGLVKFKLGKSVNISKLEQRRREFKEITMNYFDEEFQISSDNGWVKIVDENQDGLSRYNGKIPVECFG